MGIIGSHIVLAFGTVGTKKTNASIMATGAALAGVFLLIRKGQKDAEKFAQQWGALDSAQRKAVISMGAVTKDLTDTGTAMKTVATLTQSQIKWTSELTDAIAKLGVMQGQQLGESYDQIQVRIGKLTDAVAKGQSRALKSLGIDLEETEVLHLAQAEAMEKVIERAKDVTIEIQNMSQAMSVIENHWDTAIGLSWDWASQTDLLGGSLEWVIEKLGQTNTMMAETDGAIMDIIYSGDNMIGFFGALATTLISRGKSWEDYNKHLREAAALQVAFNKSYMHGQDLLQWREKRKQEAVDVEGQAEFEEWLAGDQSVMGQTYVEDASEQKFTTSAPTAKKPPGGGGGRGKKAKELATAEKELVIARQQMVEITEQQAVAIREVEIAETSMWDVRLTNARAEQEIMNERFAALEELAAVDPRYMTTEEKHELWDLEKEQMDERRVYQEERLEYMAEELSFAEEFGLAWEKAIGQVTVAERTAYVVMDALHGTTEHFLAALIKGAPLSAKALATLVAELAFKEAVYWTAQGLAKEGVALYNFISPYGDKTEGAAAQQAAGQYYAAAAMLGTISAALGQAAGAGGAKNAGGGAGAHGGAGGGYGGSGWQGSGPSEPTVVINVEGNLQDFWNTVVDRVSVRVSNQQRTGSYDALPSRAA